MTIYKNIKIRLSENDRIRLYYHKTVKKLLRLNTKRDCVLDRQEIEESLAEMKKLGSKNGRRILVSGHIGLSPRTPYLAKVNAYLSENYEIFQLIENGVDYKTLQDKKWDGISEKEYKMLKQFIVPSLFMKDIFRAYEKVYTDDESRRIVEQKQYLREAAENLRKRHFNMREDYIQYFVIQSYYYLCKVIEILHVDCVVLWNQFFAFHHIFEGICKEKEIKCMYFEFGVIPGTYAVETTGQMGESYPALEYRRFRELKVIGEDLRKAKEICQYIKSNRINRKVQPKQDISKILNKKLKKGVPTIFFAGQNDFESGLCPYTEHTKRYHSPIFQSSDEAVRYLAKLAKKNGWNLIYKMHPLVSKFCLPSKLPRNVVMLNNANINDLIEKADLTITVLSQTGYVALFNEKPVLMLGYTQLRGKGCNYEAFELEKVEQEIKTALENGFTEKQKDNFIMHVAQITKYYVFDDEWFDKAISYGKTIRDCAELITQYLEK